MIVPPPEWLAARRIGPARIIPQYAKDWDCAVTLEGMLNYLIEARLAGCINWKPKHGIGPYCANCGYHETEHRR